MASNQNSEKRVPIDRRLSRTTLVASVVPSVLSIFFLLLTDASLYIVGIVAILLGFLTVFAVSSVWRDTQYQFRSLHNLLDAVVNGDYSLRGANSIRDGAFGELIATINALANTMQRQRLQSEESQLLMLKVVDQIDVAIIAWNQNRQIQLINPAAKDLLGVHNKLDEQSGNFGSIPDSLIFAINMPTGTTDVKNITFEASQGRFRVHREHFISEGRTQSLLFITNVSNILRLEEQRAWRNLVRVLSHEINNSLTPLKSFSSTLIKQVELREQDAELKSELVEGMSVIGDRAESLRDFVQSYHKIAQLPEPDKKKTDISELMHRLAKLFPQTEIRLEGSKAVVEIDAAQIEQVVINLIKNSIEASSETDPVEIVWKIEGSQLQIQIVDSGEGILNPENLFTPYYTTKVSGSGIGLVFCQQVIEAHGGYMDVSNRLEHQGCVVKISLPRVT